MTAVTFEIPETDPCWYCHCPPGDDLVFSWEFDTFVHLACIRDRISTEPHDREAAILSREFGVEPNPMPKVDNVTSCPVNMKCPGCQRCW